MKSIYTEILFLPEERWFVFHIYSDIQVNDSDIENVNILQVKDDWRYIALVIDRLLLWIYVSVCLVGSTSMLLRAPMHYDTRIPIQEKP